MICGPLHVNSVDMIPYYLTKFQSVVYSTWTPFTNVENEILSKVRKYLPEDKIVISSYSSLPKKFYNYQNIYLQVWTWRQACKLVNTKFCVKTRTNCLYKNFDPLLAKINEYPNKIVCISAFFRKVTFNEYSPSDYIIYMKTSEAMEATRYTLEILEPGDSNYLHCTAERKICYGQMRARGVIKCPSEIFANNNIEICRRIMMENYEIVDVNLLEPTIMVHNMSRTYFDHVPDNSIWDIQNV